jgi:hypothetical protein
MQQGVGGYAKRLGGFGICPDPADEERFMRGTKAPALHVVGKTEHLVGRLNHPGGEDDRALAGTAIDQPLLLEPVERRPRCGAADAEHLVQPGLGGYDLAGREDTLGDRMPQSLGNLEPERKRAGLWKRIVPHFCYIVRTS